MEMQEILSLLPHQKPFVFLHKVLDYLPGKRLHVEFNPNEIKHVFSGQLYIPDVILIEGLAQSSVLLTQLETKPIQKGEFPLLGSVSAEIHSKIGWTQVLQYKVSPLRLTSKQAIITGLVKNEENRTIVSGTLSVAVSKE